MSDIAKKIESIESETVREVLIATNERIDINVTNISENTQRIGKLEERVETVESVTKYIKPKTMKLMNERFPAVLSKVTSIDLAFRTGDLEAKVDNKLEVVKEVDLVIESQHIESEPFSPITIEEFFADQYCKDVKIVMSNGEETTFQKKFNSVKMLEKMMNAKEIKGIKEAKTEITKNKRRANAMWRVISTDEGKDERDIVKSNKMKEFIEGLYSDFVKNEKKLYDEIQSKKEQI